MDQQAGACGTENEGRSRVGSEGAWPTMRLLCCSRWRWHADKPLGDEGPGRYASVF